MNKTFIRQAKSRIALLLFALCACWSPQAAAQSRSLPRVTIRMERAAMSEIMSEIERQTKYLFVTGADVRTDRIVSLDVSAVPLTEALDRMVAGADLAYDIRSLSIILSVRQTEQPAVVTGQVRDVNGAPIVGATVIVRGTSSGATTDGEGRFSLSVSAPSTASIEVSYLGYESQTLAVGRRTSFEITLRERASEIESVVVTALGIKRAEKALSYNVQQVLSDEITAVKDPSFINSLSGKVAGLNIKSTSSGAGGASKVTMRGSRSIQGSSDALYVIDGVPMYNGSRRSEETLSDSPFASTGTTDMSADINPEDIESVSVLTGAAAAALYGSSGANGAIVINTKRGTREKTVVTVTQNTEFSTAFVTPRFQNRYGTSEDNRNMSWGSRLNDSNHMGYDPFEDYFQTGVTTTETVSLSTGNNRNQTYVSAAALNSEGIVPNSRYDRYNFTFRNTTSFLHERMTLNVGGSYIRQRDLNMTNQGVYSNPIASAYLYPRGNDWNNVRMFEQWDMERKISLPRWDMDAGEYVLQNPYWINYRNLRENKRDRYLFNASLSYRPAPWLEIAGRISLDASADNGTQKNYAGTNDQLTESSKNGLYGESREVNRQIYGDVMANINKTFGEAWSLNATLGASYKDGKNEYRNISGPIRDGSIEGETALPPNVFSLYQLSSSKSKRVIGGWREREQSLFASVEVGFRETCYLTATVRTDWPSQLSGAESMQSSFTYPSVGLAVVLSEMFRMPEQLSFLKLRASYANVGMPFRRFLSNPTYAWDNTLNEWSQKREYKPVADLKPEYTHSWEVGLTMRFLRHFDLDFTYYNTRTVNQLINTGISPGAGYATMYVQDGEVRNRGVELRLGYRNRWNKFAWDTDFTVSANRNRILKLGGNVFNESTGESTSFSYLSMGGLDKSVKFLLKEGGTLGDLYTPLDLVRDHEGKIYVDSKGQVALDTSNKPVDRWTKLGSIFPKAELSWRNGFSVSNLSFGFLLTARIGGVVYSRTQATLDYYGVSEASAAARDAGGVVVNGVDRISARNWYSTVSQSNGFAPLYTYDATNVRLQEASIGYTIPRKWLGDVCRITVSLVGRNLWMIYNKAPFDPESTATVSDNYYQGIDYFMQPGLRNLGFSVRLTF